MCLWRTRSTVISLNSPIELFILLSLLRYCRVIFNLLLILPINLCDLSLKVLKFLSTTCFEIDLLLVTNGLGLSSFGFLFANINKLGSFVLSLALHLASFIKDALQFIRCRRDLLIGVLFDLSKVGLFNIQSSLTFLSRLFGSLI